MAARRVLVGPLLKSLGINAVYRSHLSSNPNPDRVLGLSRPFATVSESGRRPHWATEYRRRLGIGDSHVRIPRNFLPEKDGEIKIAFAAWSATGTTNEGEPHKSGTVVAVARKSSGDLLGLTAGHTKYKGGDILELSLYAMKAASNLAKEIKSTGLHDGPVVYVACNPLLAEFFHGKFEGEPDELRRNMPRDEELEEAGQSCTIYCGSREKLKEMLPAHFQYLLEKV